MKPRSSKASSSRKAPKSSKAKTKPTRGARAASKVSRKGKDKARAKRKVARPSSAGKSRSSGPKGVSSRKTAAKGAAGMKAPRKAPAPATRDEEKPKNTNPPMGDTQDLAAQPVAPYTGIPQPPDPDELKAKADLQRKEARAPMMPMHNAPTPMPPQSGKPIWSLPHSS